MKKFTAEQKPEVVEIEDLAPPFNDSIREHKATVTSLYNCRSVDGSEENGCFIRNGVK